MYEIRFFNSPAIKHSYTQSSKILLTQTEFLCLFITIPTVVNIEYFCAKNWWDTKMRFLRINLDIGDVIFIL